MIISVLLRYYEPSDEVHGIGNTIYGYSYKFQYNQILFYLKFFLLFQVSLLPEHPHYVKSLTFTQSFLQ
jgi:hypothetical protein